MTRFRDSAAALAVAPAAAPLHAPDEFYIARRTDGRTSPPCWCW